MHFAKRHLAAAFPLLFIACALEREPAAPVDAATNIVQLTTVSCGATIVTDLKLDNDLTCTGDAMTIGADDLKINLNGHTIAGAGAGNGITVRTRHDIMIHGGTIRGFVSGLFVAQSTKIDIKEMALTQNREAVFFNGTTGSTVKGNVIWANQQRGVMLRPTAGGLVSTDNQVSGNLIMDNPTGILVFGQPGNTLKDNTITGSSLAGIDFLDAGSTGNVVKENQLSSNAAAIRLSAGWTGNTFAENWIQLNTCGFKGSTTGNSLLENVFAGNATNFCLP
jgi:parallel beta-helix repeat protein